MTHIATRRSLVTAVLGTVAIAAITNGSLAALHLNAPRAIHWPAFAPPGAVIGIVWIVLFAGMGAALALASERRSVAILIGLCLAYPFYTHLIPGHATELIGNLVTLAYALWLTFALRRTPLAATCIAAVAAWIIFATALVIALVQLNGW